MKKIETLEVNKMILLHNDNLFGHFSFSVRVLLLDTKISAILLFYLNLTYLILKIEPDVFETINRSNWRTLSKQFDDVFSESFATKTF